MMIHVDIKFQIFLYFYMHITVYLHFSRYFRENIRYIQHKFLIKLLGCLLFCILKLYIIYKTYQCFGIKMLYVIDIILHSVIFCEDMYIGI